MKPNHEPNMKYSNEKGDGESGQNKQSLRDRKNNTEKLNSGFSKAQRKQGV